MVPQHESANRTSGDGSLPLDTTIQQPTTNQDISLNAHIDHTTHNIPPPLSSDDSTSEFDENDHYLSINQLHLEDDTDHLDDRQANQDNSAAWIAESSQHADDPSDTSCNSSQEKEAPSADQEPVTTSNKRKQIGGGKTLQNASPAPQKTASSTTTQPNATDTHSPSESIPLHKLPTKHTISIDDFSMSVENFKVLCHNLHKTLEVTPPTSKTYMETLLSLNRLVELLCDDPSIQASPDASSLIKANIHFFIYFCIPFTVKFILSNKLTHFDKLSQSDISLVNEQMFKTYAEITGITTLDDEHLDESLHTTSTSSSAVTPSPASPSRNPPLTPRDKSQPFILKVIENYLYNVLTFYIARLERDAQRNREHIQESWKKNAFETRIKDLPDVSHLFQTLELIANQQFFYENNGVYSRNTKLFHKDMAEFSLTPVPEQDWRTKYESFVFATPSKLRRDVVSSYHLRNLNIMGRLGAFQILLKFLEKSEFNTPHMMMICLRVLLTSCRTLNQTIVDEIPGLCFDAIQEYFENLNDKQLRAFKFGAFEDIIKLVQDLARQSHQQYDENQFRDSLQLSLYFSCFSSNLVDARMKGLAQLKLLIKEVVEVTQEKKNSVYYNAPPDTRWMSTKQLISWLEEHKIMARLTSGDLNLSVLQQSKPLLLFLGRNSSISSDDVDALWNSASGKHVSLQQCTFSLILTILPFLSLQTLLHVLDRFKETQLRHLQSHMLDFLRDFIEPASRKYKKKISLDILWALMQDNEQVPLELSQKSCVIIQDLISQPEFEHQRKTLIQLCCENIKMNLSVTQTLNLLKHIISTYPMKNKKKNSVWGVIDQLNEKYELIQILLDSLTTEGDLFSPERAANGSVNVLGRNCTLKQLIELYERPSEEQQRSSRYSPEKKINAKLTFLTYLLKHSNVSMSFTQCEKLWQNLYQNTSDTKIQGIFLDWLKSTRSTSSRNQHVLSDTTTEEVFEKIIKRIDMHTMTLPALYLFLHFLISLNIQDRKINPIHTTSSNPKSKSFNDRLANFIGNSSKKKGLKKNAKPTKFEILTNHLTGIDHVWNIILDADSVPVYKTAINFLNDFHFEFSPQLQNLEGEFRKKHISVCMNKIKMAWHFVAEEGVDVETNRQHILRCLDVLLDYIHLHTRVQSGNASDNSSTQSSDTTLTNDSAQGNTAPNQAQIKLRVSVPNVETAFVVTLKKTATLKSLYTVVQNRIGKNVRLYANDVEVPCDAMETVWDAKLRTNHMLVAKIKESKGLGLLADTLSSAFGIKSKSSLSRTDSKKSSKSGTSAAKKRNSSSTSSTPISAPTLPISFLSESYFSDLVELLKMHDDEVGDKVWRLMQELPKNPAMIHELESFPAVTDAVPKRILSADSIHLLLYRLEIIEEFLNKTDKHKRHAWEEAFVQRGGIEHLLSIMTQGQNLSRTLLHKECYASVLKILNIVFDLLKNPKQGLMESIVDAVLLTAPAAVDAQSGRPRAMSYKGHVRLNSSDMTEVSGMMIKQGIQNTSKKSAIGIEAQKHAYYMVIQTIVCGVMDLLTSCAKGRISIAHRICSDPSTKIMIWNALVAFPANGVREEMAECLLELAKEMSESTNVVSAFIVKYLFENINRIEKFERRSRDYFLVLEELIPLCPLEKTCENTINPPDANERIEEKIEAEYIRIIIEKILSRPIKEADPSTEDPVLVGLFRVAKVLIARHSSAVKYELGSASGGVGLISEIFHSCLFDSPTGSISSGATSHPQSVQIPPKCKSSPSRTAAFELLVELISDCSQNAEELLNLTRSYVINEEESFTERLTWRFKPRALSKSNVGYVGLRNLGATCYINSLMQQLFMTLPFREGLLSVLEYDRSKSDNHQVLYQMQKLFGFLQDSAKSWFNLEEFCETYKDFEGNPIHPGRQQDANEFFNFLFDKIEDALRGTPQASLLKDIFGGRLVNRTEFEIDGNPFVNNMDEIFYGMNLEVKHQNSIGGSLKLLNNGEMMKGDTAYYSEEHKKKVNAFRRTYIKKLPPVLIFHLKRFEFHISSMTSTKLNDKIQFPETLDMYPYTIEGVAESEEWENRDEFKKMDPNYYHYSLVGVLVHSGGVNSGHYYSFIMDRSQSDHPWFEFNDCSLNKFDKARLADECFGGIDEMPVRGKDGQFVSKRRVFRQNNAYMLFYQRTSLLHESLTEVKRIPRVEIDTVQLGGFAPVETTANPNAQMVHKTLLSSHWTNTMNAVNFLVRLNRSKRQNVSTPQKETFMPTHIKEEVWRDNTVFYYQRNLFDPSFDKFLFELAHKSNIGPESGTTDMTVYLFFVFQILVRSSFHEKTLPDWTEFFSHRFKENRESCEQFLEYFDKKNLIALLLTCPFAQVRNVVGVLLMRAICALKEHGSPVELEYVQVVPPSLNGIEPLSAQFGNLAESGAAGIIVEVIRRMLVLLSEESAAKRFPHHTSELFTLLYEFSLLGLQERNLLLSFDFVQAVVDLLSTATEQMFSLSSTFGRQPLEAALSLTSVLVRSCETVTTLKVTNIAPPPTFVDDRTLGMELSTEARKKLFHSPFFGSLIAQNVNVVALSDMLCHWCWESVQISKNFAKLLQNIIQSPKCPKNMALTDYLQPYFTIFLNLVEIGDSKAEQRLSTILDTFLDRMHRDELDSNVARICMKFLLARREANIRAWLNSRTDDIKELCVLFDLHHVKG
mmetsp:Transcript_5901/g.22384  ORF Transcript_5901/g.22384 Transcript_5901/m.22384 type:complete len:2668 (-) Transcript_5901:111-8114(-)|eukprot:CAMPEP_0117448614 /NCGR_PEP_ID=MMETSP0759-20121206/7497_1 /TAXON_ID=63605 /ORGANISM="Percolomonas cosmopolitus, Strain WS" /LENGTH=2667 /DNA_ID=CAMNT_0005241017 /DNA_START=412 /DNA_END=8415 /DNA_ORIENTATION=+